MDNKLKSKQNKVFFVGICGVSMSALALLTHSFGSVVAGSDANVTNVDGFFDNKIKVYHGHNKNNIIRFKPDLVVYTGAILQDNPELVQAKTMGIKTMERKEYLGLVCSKYNHVIAISGTHGKTTTTALIGHIFNTAGLEPTVHVGGVCLNFNSNLCLGDSSYFITEACEYKKSFEYLKPECGVVTNIECDHMDCYQNLNDLKQSFTYFLDNSKICVLNDKNDVLNLVSTKQVYTFGGNNANFSVKNVENHKTYLVFDFYENGKFLANFKLNLMGEYNVKNALVAISVARIYGIGVPAIYDALNTFLGVERRNEKLGEIGQTLVYADYCHHPTEIRNSICNFSNIFKRVLCVFQPHTYSRTTALFSDFLKCFKGVGKLIIFKTYPAREKYNKKGSETTLYTALKLKNKQLVMDKNELINVLHNECNNYDCIIVLGAGDVYNIVKDGLQFNK